VNKKEKLLTWLNSGEKTGYIPAAFFIHFPIEYHRGQAAVQKHLEYFKYTGMDFVKIQYEFPFPHLPEIQEPEDWTSMPVYRDAFFHEQLRIVEGLVQATDHRACVIQTLYSPFMSAGHTTGDELITAHIRKAPDKVKKGLEIITESILWFVKACARIGVDGFYASTQGGENHRFSGTSLFTEVVKPFDMAVMDTANQLTDFNILHICDYNGGYSDLSPFLDYPGDVVNCPLKLGDQLLPPSDAAQLFQKPIMGGMDRHGVMVDGTEDEIIAQVQSILSQAPGRFILGADCTLPSDITWSRIRTAVETAHMHPSKA
jgi:uroporphyrinogen decarboxylase